MYTFPFLFLYVLLGKSTMQMDGSVNSVSIHTCLAFNTQLYKYRILQVNLELVHSLLNHSHTQLKFHAPERFQVNGE